MFCVGCASLAATCAPCARSRRVLKHREANRAYARSPLLLCIDEVGYLSYDDVRHADLLFAVFARRHEKKRAIALTTNKDFAKWHTTFPNASCVVALVDRLINRADIVAIDGDSYRLREAGLIDAATRAAKGTIPVGSKPNGIVFRAK